MKSYLKPEEVAEMATFIISEKAKSMSGQVLEMDYGINLTFKI
jgi:enoyl-[acyl-carrier-protein] reductase (NADH)